MNWVTFVGEGRSGHTILSAIIGSHPCARVAEEQKYITHYSRDGDSREKIMSDLLASGIGKARKELGFEGILEHKDLKVIGDKCGWDAVNEYMKRGAPADILSRFSGHMGMPVKTIVTLRNPIENINAWVSSPKYQRKYGDRNVLYRKMIKRYIRFHRHAIDIIENQDTFFVYNEDLIQHPKEVIFQLANWLELPPDPVWVNNCASKVFKKPHTREIEWPEVYRVRVENYIEECPLFEYYRSKS